MVFSIMWVRCFLLSYGLALRASEPPALVSESAKKNIVELALTLTNPEASTGKLIEIAVDGVRHSSKTHPTQSGKPVVLHHIAKGSVVTAHVGTRGACAVWVALGVKHCTVGEWELAFTTVEENEQGTVSAAQYEAYVKIVGWGSAITIDVDHSTMYIFDAVAPNETLVHAGLQRGDLVRAISTATRDTCMYRVGNAETWCHLDGTWGLLLGSVMEFGEDDVDEGAAYTEIKQYTVDFALERDDAAATKLDIGLNGLKIASKMNATETGKSIIVHHVKGGSVFTAVADDIGEACCVYVGAGIGVQTVKCAGWTMNLNIQEETDSSFENMEKLYDVGFTVHRVNKETTGVWGLSANDEAQVTDSLPRFFPGNMGGWSKRTQIVPVVDNVLSRGCAHVVGGNETTCEFSGWNFTLWSKLNMNEPWDGKYWDWADIDTNVTIDPEWFEIEVTATDRTDSSMESTLECIAREDFEFFAAPLGEIKKHIAANEPLFKTKILKPTTTESIVKSATFVGQFPAGYYLEKGFSCTVYREEQVMCEANTDGGSWTNDPGFTLEIFIP